MLLNNSSIVVKCRWREIDCWLWSIVAACLATYATESVMQLCHGMRQCSVTADAATFGSPCNKLSKTYLKVVYTCGLYKNTIRSSLLKKITFLNCLGSSLSKIVVLWTKDFNDHTPSTATIMKRMQNWKLLTTHTYLETKYQETIK